MMLLVAGRWFVVSFVCALRYCKEYGSLLFSLVLI
jgi:hypothetical protein